MLNRRDFVKTAAIAPVVVFPFYETKRIILPTKTKSEEVDTIFPNLRDDLLKYYSQLADQTFQGNLSVQKAAAFWKGCAKVDKLADSKTKIYQTTRCDFIGRALPKAEMFRLVRQEFIPPLEGVEFVRFGTCWCNESLLNMKSDFAEVFLLETIFPLAGIIFHSSICVAGPADQKRYYNVWIFQQPRRHPDLDVQETSQTNRYRHTTTEEILKKHGAPWEQPATNVYEIIEFLNAADLREKILDAGFTIPNFVL